MTADRRIEFGEKPPASIGASPRFGLGGGSGIRQPIALKSPTGNVFVTSEGRVLVRGTRRVKPVE